MREQDFRKYLRKNPGREIPELAGFRHCTVIPAWNENQYIPQVLKSVERARKNGNISGADEAQKTMQAILDRIPFLDQVNNGKDGLLQKKNFDNDTADQLRHAAAAAILKLEGKEF